MIAVTRWVLLDHVARWIAELTVVTCTTERRKLLDLETEKEKASPDSEPEDAKPAKRLKEELEGKVRISPRGAEASRRRVQSATKETAAEAERGQA